MFFKPLYLFSLSVGILLSALCHEAKAEIEIVQVGEGFQQISLGRYIQLYPCKGKPSLLRVKRDTLSFNNNYEEVLNLPTTESDRGYWVKFKVRNTTDERKQLIIEIDNPLLKEVEFFEVTNKIENNNYTGNRFEYDTRHEKHTAFLFRARLAPQETKDYYFYIHQQGQSITLPIYLYTTEAFYTRLSIVQARVWLAVGALLMLALALWWFAGKFWNDFFAALALYVSSWVMLVMVYSGISYSLLWRDAYHWNVWSVEIFQALNALFVVRMGYKFWRSYTIVPQALLLFNVFLYVSGTLCGITIFLMYFDLQLPPYLATHVTGFWYVAMNVSVWLLLVCWEISVSKQFWNVLIFVGSILLGILLGIVLYRNPTSHYFYTEPIWLATITGFNIYMTWLAMRRVHFVQNKHKLDQWLSAQRIRNKK